MMVTTKTITTTAYLQGVILAATCIPLPSVVVDAVFVGTVLLPHGDFAYDPTLLHDGTIERCRANEVAQSSRAAGRWLLMSYDEEGRGFKHLRHTSIAATDPPDIILMTTPHGIKLEYEYGLYLSPKGSGTATIGNDLMPSSTRRYNVTLDVDLAPIEIGRDLLEWLTKTKTSTRMATTSTASSARRTADSSSTFSINREHPSRTKRFPVTGIYSYNDDTPMPLNWGEIIPMLLLQQDYPIPSYLGNESTDRTVYEEGTMGALNLPKLLIWTFPYRRYDHAIDMVPELLQIGDRIMQWIDHRPERIGVVVSGDLSHTHQPTGPYGYSNASALFDAAVGRWAGGGGHGGGFDGTLRKADSDYGDPCAKHSARALLDVARKLQPDAKSCGFTGYVLWHGMMRCPTTTTTTTTKRSNRNNNDDVGTNASHVASDTNIVHNHDSHQQQFRSKVLVNRNVTYYGMMAAIFEPFNHTKPSF